MQFPHIISVSLVVLISQLCSAYSPVQLDSPTVAPNCPSFPPTTCNFTNALEDVDAKVLANNGSSPRPFEGPPTSYVDCSECVYYRRWSKASIFWSQTNGTILLQPTDWRIPTFAMTWNGLMSETKAEAGYPSSEIQIDRTPEGSYSYVQLQRGRIYEPFFPLYGPIYDAWVAAGGSQALGVPEMTLACGVYGTDGLRACSCSFKDGARSKSAVFWDSDTGVHIVWPRVMSTYETVDWTHRLHAFSDAEPVPNSDKKYMKFSPPYDRNRETVILWSETESWIVQPSFWTYYQQHGGFGGSFGLPTTNTSSSVEFSSALTENDEWRVGREGRALGHYQSFGKRSIYASFSYQGPDWVDDWRITAMYDFDGSLKDPPPLLKFSWTLSHTTAAQGEVFFTYAPQTQEARLTTSFTFGAGQTSTFALVCLLRDGDGQFYTFSHSESLAGGNGIQPQTLLSERVLSNDTVFGDIYQVPGDITTKYPINWRALLFANPLDCRIGFNVDVLNLRRQLEQRAMSRGHYVFRNKRWGGQGASIPYTIELS